MVAGSPKPQPFEEESPLFSSINEGYAEGSIEVYAPITWETRSERRRTIEALRQPIKEAIETIAKTHLQGGA